jgi:glycine cleavage system aminomethyltransferase T
LTIRKLSAGVAAAVMVGALGMASMAFAGADTDVTIKGRNGDYHGKVLSERAKCQYGRTVVVFKQKGKKQDPSTDKKIGKDTSEKQGNVGVWDIGNSGFKHGKFYALARHSRGCNAATSDTIKR